jgi:phosphoglycerate kinase
MKTLKDLDINNKKVIIRCDFNVPMKDGKITDDTRIVGALPTIKYCLDHNAKVILLSHLGRVKEEADLAENDLSPVAERLSVLLEQDVLFSTETRGQELEDAIQMMQPKDVILIQNTRYEDLDGKKESSNDPELGKYWASLGEVFINDAFGTIHRAHASNCGIAAHLPSAFGFLIEKELTALSELDKPEHPFVVILGGAKVADKIGVIENLVTKADKILIGGGMAFTFLKAKGVEIGKSLLDEENIEFCKKILKDYSEKIVLPIDVAVTNEYTNDEEYRIKTIEEISKDEMGLDIGNKTEELFEKELSSAKIVVWNGPLGVYEFSKYKKNTDKLLKYIVENNIKTILGGGDIVAAAQDYKDKIYHVSTGGGATLEYLEGKKLPGVEAIK